MVYLISSCTNVKKIKAEDVNLLRNSDFSNLDKSCNRWKENLNDNSLIRIIARDLYQGPSWRATLEAERNLQTTIDTKLLVASAGYGLIDADTSVCSYGSTFSKGHQDSIYNFYDTQNATQRWWNKVNLLSIDQFEKESHFFIFVSSEYLIAMEKYLENLLDVFGKKVFILVSSQKHFSKKIEKNLIRFDTRFNSYEAGTLTTLPQRCMRWLSKEISENRVPMELESIKEHVSNFLSDMKPYSLKVGKQISDDELSSMIIEQIETKNIASATQGLRDLRKSGFACEQRRYGKSFNLLKGQNRRG